MKWKFDFISFCIGVLTGAIGAFGAIVAINFIMRG